jgi:hypothetical protein
MPTRLTSVVIDSADPSTLGRWWASALGWEVTFQNADETDVEPPAGRPGIELTFVPVTDKRLLKNRIHFDLNSVDLAGQDDLIQRLMATGATEVDLGQGDVPWAVLADPEGNEFCVLEPRPEYADSGTLAAIVVDALDPAALIEFWAAASGWERHSVQDQVGLRSPGGGGPWLEFVPTTEPHTVKNRLHLDVAPYAQDDQSAEVARLTALGARPADVGQAEADPESITWVVLSDPEQNEFCILSAR